MRKLTILLAFILPILAFAQKTSTTFANTQEKVQINSSNIGRNCIAEGAIIKMANNTTKRIERIVSGDIILAFSDNKLEAKEVTATHTSVHRELYKLRLKDGKNIIVTGDHPFWTNSGWKSINPNKTKLYKRYENLRVGKLEVENTVKVLVGDDNTSSAEVVEIDQIKKKANTYTIELEDDWAFIANGIIVGQE